MAVTHSTVVVVPDDGTSPVGTDEWNAAHTVTLADGKILVGNGLGVAAEVTPSGDATMTNAGIVSVNKTRLVVRNETGSTITSTKVVYAVGFNNFPLVAPADNTDEAKHDFIGLTVAPIADQANGYIATTGECDAETNAWAVGTQLFYTTSGAITSTPPTTGEVRHIGYVTVQQNYPTGKILLETQFENNVRAVGAGAGIVDRLGDNAGATKISWRDYADAEIASLDSNGNFAIAGTMIGGNGSVIAMMSGMNWG